MGKVEALLDGGVDGHYEQPPMDAPPTVKAPIVAVCARVQHERLGAADRSAPRGVDPVRIASSPAIPGRATRVEGELSCRRPTGTNGIPRTRARATTTSPDAAGAQDQGCC